MREPKNLIPEDTRNSLNANPSFQWLVIVIMFVVGVFLVNSGIKGIKTKKLNGRVFEGTTARVLGAVYVLLGVALPLIAITLRVALRIATKF